MSAAQGRDTNDDEKRSRTRPRAPSRERGMVRYNVLLDAVETLLRERSPDDVGMYQIAQAADVPPASVYHFFPTRDAAFVALVERYIAGFHENSRTPFAAARLESWQDLMGIEQERARAHFGANPPALKLLYGGYGGLESRRIDNAFMALLAERMYPRYDTLFHMPYLAFPARTFHISWSIMDAIWSLSYLKEGHITDEYAAEALSACVAYCRRFLPERVEVRAPIRELAAQGGKVTLPIG